MFYSGTRISVISSLNNVVILCGTNNLFQDSSEDIGGILPRDDSWSINRVLIKYGKEILRAKCSRSLIIYVNYDSC